MISPKIACLWMMEFLGFKEVYGGIFLRKHAILNLRTYAGFRFRSEDFSDLLVAKLHFNILFTDYLSLGFELNSLSTVFKKSSSSQIEIEKKLINNEYNAQSQRFNMLNSSRLEAYVYGGLRWSQTNQVRIGATFVPDGENTAHGFGVFIDWQTSFVVTSAGLIPSDFSRGKQKRKRRAGGVDLRDYGPKIKEKRKKKEEKKRSSFF